MSSRTQLLRNQASDKVQRRVLKEVVNLLKERLVLCLSGIAGWAREDNANLTRSFGHKDLITSHVAGSSVVLGVRDAPGVVRNQKSGVKNPAD